MSLLIGQTDYQYITKIELPYHGYSVAIPHPTQVGKYERKNFYGTKKTLEEYLAAAIVWRDQRHLLLHGREVPNRIFHRQQNGSKTGIPGVRYVEKVVKKKLKDGSVAHYQVPCIIAEIFTLPGRDYKRSSGSKSKTFSIRKFGEDEAVRLATEWRKESEKVFGSMATNQLNND